MFNTIFPKIHKEGYKFLAISILATFIVLFFSKFLVYFYFNNYMGLLFFSRSRSIFNK